MAKKSADKNLNLKHKSLSTRAIRSGTSAKKYADALIFPIFQTSTYTYKNTREIEDFTLRAKDRFEYGRYGNPTAQLAEQRLAALEGAQECVVFASGMNAITTTIFAFVAPGDHIVVTDDCYRRTRRFCNVYLKQFRVDTTFVPFGDYKAIDNAVQKNTRLILSESPTNPYLKVLDFNKLKKVATKHRLLTLIDSTLSTPANCRPLDFGMDIVLQSATKYLSGHNDLLAGAALGRKKLLDKVRQLHKTLGGVIDPHCCYLLIRGLKTFAVRIERLNKSAMKIAEFLDAHRKIRKVYYPFLKSHQYHKLAKKQMAGGGAIVTFEIKGNLTAAKRFLNNLKLCSIGPSLGGAETLITHPAMVNFYEYTRKQRLLMGITDTLFRLSVGLENVEDIIEDIKNALKRTG